MASFTKHARSQSKQRGIPPAVVEWLQAFGASTRHKGADVYYFDKPARKRLESHLGGLTYRRISDLLDVYAVISDEGTVITAANRLKARVRFWLYLWPR